MKSRQIGVALVEFALVLPLLLILSFITTEYSRALYQYNTITKSVRDAARYLSTQNPNTNNTQAANLVVYGKLNPLITDKALAIGLTTAKVATPVWALAGASPVVNTVKVTVTGYTFVPLFASAFGLDFGTINYADISATMRGAL